MIHRRPAPAAVGAALAVAALAQAPALAQSNEELQRELETLRRQNEALMNRLEQLERQVEQQGRIVEQQAEIVEQQRAQVEDAPDVRVEPDESAVTLKISGRISQALLFADNGDDATFFVVDNDNSGSRFGLTAEAELGEWKTGADFNLGIEVNSTDEISFDDDGPVDTSAANAADFVSIRQLNWFAEHPAYGFFSVGFGDTATEDVSQADVTGTDIVMESDVDDTAGGLELVDGDGNVMGEIDDFFSNLDGDRTSRIYYETPQVAGFQIAGAARQENGLRADLAALFGARIAGWETEAAVGWRPEEDADTVHGSVSTLAPFGIHLTFAGSLSAVDDDDLDDENFFYIKSGYNAARFDFGETRLAVDYFNGDSNEVTVGDDQSDAQSVGIGVVQAIPDLSLDLYAHGRWYDVGLPGEVEDPDALLALLTGGRVRF